jgi:hypothetical protein
MKLILNVYKDDTLTELSRTVEAERVKIPYRVAIYVAKSLDGVSLKNEDDIFNFVINSLDKLDKIIKATFGLSESELECIDALELGNVGVEIYKWAIAKFKELKAQGDNSKNAEAAE